MVSSTHKDPQGFKILRCFARISTVFFILYYLLLLLIMVLMFNPKPGSHYAALGDYLIAGSILIYIVGLILTFKWELWGSVVSLCWIIIAITYTSIYLQSSSIKHFSIMIIPCLVNIFSWYLHKTKGQTNPYQ